MKKNLVLLSGVSPFFWLATSLLEQGAAAAAVAGSGGGGGGYYSGESVSSKLVFVDFELYRSSWLCCCIDFDSMCFIAV